MEYKSEYKPVEAVEKEAKEDDDSSFGSDLKWE